jgi:hypothetical protein
VKSSDSSSLKPNTSACGHVRIEPRETVRRRGAQSRLHDIAVRIEDAKLRHETLGLGARLIGRQQRCATEIGTRASDGSEELDQRLMRQHQRAAHDTGAQQLFRDALLHGIARIEPVDQDIAIDEAYHGRRGPPWSNRAP